MTMWLASLRVAVSCTNTLVKYHDAVICIMVASVVEAVASVTVAVATVVDALSSRPTITSEMHNY